MQNIGAKLFTTCRIDWVKMHAYDVTFISLCDQLLCWEQELAMGWTLIIHLKNMPETE